MGSGQTASEINTFLKYKVRFEKEISCHSVPERCNDTMRALHTLLSRR